MPFAVRKLPWRAAALLMGYFLAAFMFTRIHFNSTVEYRRASLKSLAHGQAQTPFQYRILVPMAARCAARALCLDTALAYKVIEFVVVAALLLSYRTYLIGFFDYRTSTVFSFLLLYPMLWNYCALGRLYFPSDVPAILFFVVGTNCLLKRRLLLFYCVYVLACLNRETSIVLALVCLVIRPPGDAWPDTWMRVARLVAIWLLVKVCLTYAFLGNEGERFCEVHYWENLYFVRALIRLRPHAMRYLLMFGGAWWSIPVVWTRLPTAARRMLLVCIPYVAVAAVGARLNDARVYAELIPPVFAASLFWLCRAIGSDGRALSGRRNKVLPIPQSVDVAPPAQNLSPPRNSDPCASLTNCAVNTSRAKAKRGSWWVFALCLLLADLCVRVHERSTVEYHGNTRVALAMGTAPTPFQYRILIPFLAKRLWLGLGWDLRAVLNRTNMLFVVALLLAYRSYLADYVGRRSASRLCFLILVPILFNYCALNRLYYPSDLPAVSFFVLGALCIRRRWWPAYYFVFVLAALNRETSCFLTLLFLVTAYSRRRWVFVGGHCVIQLVIWLAVKFSLVQFFTDNPGQALVEIKLWPNLLFISRLLSFDPEALQYLCTFGLAWAVIPLVWHELPLRPKRALLVAVPFLVGMSVVGNLDEVRIYGELIPIVTTPAVIWLHNVTMSCRDVDT